MRDRQSIWEGRLRESCSVVLAAVVLATVPACAFQEPVPQRHEKWGPTLRGLRMGLSPADSDGDAALAYRNWKLLFENLTDSALSLNLGMRLGNGQRFPTAVTLIHVDPRGERRAFHVSTPAVAGQIDHWIVIVQPRAQFTLSLDLEDFWSVDAKVFRLHCVAGPQRLSARFLSEGRRRPNLNDAPTDDDAVTLWKGVLESNVVAFDVGGIP